MPVQGPQSKPPKHCPEAVATKIGWANPYNGEHLVSIRDLDGAIEGYRANSKKSLGGKAKQRAGAAPAEPEAQAQEEATVKVKSIVADAQTVAHNAEASFTITLDKQTTKETKLPLQVQTDNSGVVEFASAERGVQWDKAKSEMTIPNKVKTFKIKFSQGEPSVQHTLTLTSGEQSANLQFNAPEI